LILDTKLIKLLIMNDLQKHTYQLERYHDRSSRHQCPNCGDKRSFTYYVDEDGNILDKTVGRCNHESSCGYHYTPKQYFDDNKLFEPTPIFRSNKPVEQKPISYLDKKIVSKSLSTCNRLMYYLCGYFTENQMMMAAALYFMGSTRNGDVVWYQIDQQMKIRSGKIISYQDNGHRDKDAGVNWVHSKLHIPDYNLAQCLFGLHLIDKFPDKPIALVESEKSAFICSMIDSRFLWLAIGGKSQLSEERLRPIKNRRIILHPDNDGIQEWTRKADELNRHGFNIKVSQFVANHAVEPTDDICDILMRERKPITADLSEDNTQDDKVITVEISPKQRILNDMIASNPALGTLVSNLNLQIV
jgi:hypothetical protein